MPRSAEADTEYHGRAIAALLDLLADEASTTLGNSTSNPSPASNHSSAKA